MKGYGFEIISCRNINEKNGIIRLWIKNLNIKEYEEGVERLNCLRVSYKLKQPSYKTVLLPVSENQICNFTTV
jgi:hypothetical protein